MNLRVTFDPERAAEIFELLEAANARYNRHYRNPRHVHVERHRAKRLHLERGRLVRREMEQA